MIQIILFLNSTFSMLSHVYGHVINLKVFVTFSWPPSVWTSVYPEGEDITKIFYLTGLCLWLKLNILVVVISWDCWWAVRIIWHHYNVIIIRKTTTAATLDIQHRLISGHEKRKFVGPKQFFANWCKWGVHGWLPCWD